MKPADIDFDRLLKRLNLANTRRIWRDLIDRAEAQQWSFHDFLATLVAEEIAQRSHTRLARLSHRAQFPFLKTIEEFDFTYQSTVRLALLGSPRAYRVPGLASTYRSNGYCGSASRTGRKRKVSRHLDGLVCGQAPSRRRSSGASGPASFARCGRWCGRSGGGADARAGGASHGRPGFGKSAYTSAHTARHQRQRG